MTKFELKNLMLIAIIFVAACVETDIYLPAFPDMMAWFAVSEGAIQNLLTWNFIGICLSGPFYGPLSDAIGRKKPLMWALGIFLLGSIVTVFAPSLDQMLLGRILQGIGGGGCFTLGTAIIFDAFQKESAIRALNHLNLAIPLVMAAAPMVGGYLNHVFGFRSNFMAIAALVAVSFFICQFFFKETLPKEKRTPLEIKGVVSDFKKAFCSVAFWQITVVMSVLFGGYIAFLSGTAVLFVVEFGMSKAIFPFVQAAILGGWVAGSLTLNHLMMSFGIQKVKKLGIWLTVLGGVGVGVVALFAPRDPYLLTACMTIYALGANWVIGLYFPEGMEILPDIKGVTASLMTSARLLISALIVGLASALYNATVYPLVLVVLATIIVMLPTLIFYERKRPDLPPKETPVIPSDLSF